MVKRKLARFAEMNKFDNVVHAGAEEVYNRTHALSGRWAKDFFHSSNPVILELGCGKGEYTVGLAELFPEKNFIGVDIKGARMWKGARYAYENNMDNVGFLRTRIELISSFFSSDEIEQIWLTFPDPQIKKSRKRLTSAAFLNRYRGFLRSGGLVHLKTDSKELYDYTLELIRINKLELLESTDDLYGSGKSDEILSIRTFYEQQYLDIGKSISYIKFRIDGSLRITEPDGK